MALDHRCYWLSIVVTKSSSPLLPKLVLLGQKISTLCEWSLVLHSSHFWTMISILLFLSLIRLTIPTDILNAYDQQLPGSSSQLLRSEHRASLSLRLFCDSVLFNLIDVAPLIRHGWRLVTDTSNTTLTEQTLASVDLVEKDPTNQTNLALRTPPSRHKQNRFLLPVQFSSKSKNSSGTSVPRSTRASSVSSLFSAIALPNTFVLLTTYRAVQNSSGTLFSLLDNDRVSIFEMKINRNITVTYRCENKSEELEFHPTNLIANDGLWVRDRCMKQYRGWLTRFPFQMASDHIPLWVWQRGAAIRSAAEWRNRAPVECQSITGAFLSRQCCCTRRERYS